MISIAYVGQEKKGLVSCMDGAVQGLKRLYKQEQTEIDNINTKRKKI